MQNSMLHGAAVFIDDAYHADRIIQAIGSNVVMYDEDFTITPVASNAPAGWTVTLVGTSTAVQNPAVGGELLITTGATENDGVNLQGPGLFTPGASASLALYARLKMSEVVQSDVFIGLAVTSTDILGALPKRLGFRSVDGSASMNFGSKGTSETSIADVTTLVAATYVELEAYWDHVNSVLRYYVGGALKGSFSVGANLPSDVVLRPSIHVLTGAAAAVTATVDRLRVVQIGGR